MSLTDQVQRHRRLIVTILCGMMVLGYIMFISAFIAFMNQETFANTRDFWTEILFLVTAPFLLVWMFLTGRLHISGVSTFITQVVLAIYFLFIGGLIKVWGDRTRGCDGSTVNVCNDAYVSFIGMFFSLIGWFVYMLVVTMLFGDYGSASERRGFAAIGDDADTHSQHSHAPASGKNGPPSAAAPAADSRPAEVTGAYYSSV